MTISVLRRRIRGDSLPRSEDPIAIGEVDRDVFSCPRCARPLGIGTNRCPGCNAFLVLGVPAPRAAFLLLNGLVLGVLIGGMISASLVAATQEGASPGGAGAAVVPVATMSEPGTPTATAPSEATPVPTIVPAGMSALRQATEIDSRLMAAASRIRVARELQPPDAVEISRGLRTIAGDATHGVGYIASIRSWAPAASIGAELEVAYGAAIASSREGLRVPLRDPEGYAAAADRMLVILSDIAGLDAAARVLLEAAGTVSPGGS